MPKSCSYVVRLSLASCLVVYTYLLAIFKYQHGPFQSRLELAKQYFAAISLNLQSIFTTIVNVIIVISRLHFGNAYLNFYRIMNSCILNVDGFITLPLGPEKM